MQDPGRSLVDGGDDLDMEGREPQLAEALLYPTKELRVGPREVLVARRAGVPPIRATALGERCRVLHEGDTLAFDRVGNEDLRPVVTDAKPRERLRELTVVVTIA